MMNPTKSRRVALVVLLFTTAFGVTVAGAPKAKSPQARTAHGKPQPKAKRTKFLPACAKPSYPAPAPAGSLGIDAQCGLSGAGAGPEGVQDSVKNNFCAKAQGGSPQAMTIADLTKLQAAVEKNPAINFGSENKGTRAKGPTTNRAPLKKLGEGRLVTLKAFVLIARQEGAESVNCGKNVPDAALFHDIHISLVAAPDIDDECAGVVAEMSPHHRPDVWTHANVEKVSQAKLPVRVTGQLYFDSSHFPCTKDQGAGQGNPKRIALWEVHPVYKFEVCTGGCEGAGQWITLDEWAKQKR